MSDEKSAAETLYPSSRSQNPAPGTARIELHYLPILHRGHAFLRLVNPDGSVEELHGLSYSRHTGKESPMGMDGSRLSAELEFADHADKAKFKKDARSVGTVASGSEQEIARIWERGTRAAEAIKHDPKSFDYKAHDPTYEFGGNGGQIQNSNSVAYTLGRAMGLDLDAAIKRAGVERKFSGWGRDLRDPNYERYVAPRQLAVIDAP